MICECKQAIYAVTQGLFGKMAEQIARHGTRARSAMGLTEVYLGDIGAHRRPSTQFAFRGDETVGGATPKVVNSLSEDYQFIYTKDEHVAWTKHIRSHQPDVCEFDMSVLPPVGTKLPHWSMFRTWHRTERSAETGRPKPPIQAGVLDHSGDDGRLKSLGSVDSPDAVDLVLHDLGVRKPAG